MSCYKRGFSGQATNLSGFMKWKLNELEDMQNNIHYPSLLKERRISKIQEDLRYAGAKIIEGINYSFDLD